MRTARFGGPSVSFAGVFVTPNTQSAEVIIIGGGLAGLSAAIDLGRAKRDTLLIDDGKSMARWEPDVQNYLGFPRGIAGPQLLARAREQAHRYHIRFCRDRIIGARARRRNFCLRGDSIRMGKSSSTWICEPMCAASMQPVASAPQIVK